MMKSIVLTLLPLALTAKEFPEKFHAAPKPLSRDAKVSEWPRVFGPNDNCTSPEEPLLKKFPETGLKPVFELARGESYASPILAAGKLLHFHAVKSAETLDCHHPENGKRLWTFSYPIKYRDRYGFSSGPRSSPVVHKGKIYLIGVTAKLHCLDLDSGKVIWQRDLKTELSIPQYFFGYGPNPMIHGDLLILNTGGKEKESSGSSVIGVCLKTGKTVWTHEDTWGASYASPVMAKLHGKDVALVIAAGESKPTHGGLLLLDPKTGQLHCRFPWRADIYESVLASTPLALPNNKIFISDCYQKGGVLLQIDEKFQPKTIWTERYFGMHMMTPQLIDGHLYGFAGRNIPDTQFKGINLMTGKITWEDDMRWRENNRVTGLFRGSFLQCGKRTFALGEDGSFAELSLTPEKPEILQRTRFFYARETWTPPVIHRGLLYIVQNTLGFDESSRRLICYDMRAEQ